MIDRGNLLSTLDTARDSLNKILIVVAMNGGGSNLSYSEENEYKDIVEIEKLISTLGNETIETYIIRQLNNINKSLKTQLLTLSNNKVKLCSRKVLFSYDNNCYKDTFDKFNEAEPAIRKSAEDAVDLIKSSADIVRKACSEVLKELRKQSFITMKDGICFTFFENKDLGALDITFSYMAREKVHTSVNVFNLADPKELTKELAENVISTFKRKIVVDRTKNIKRFIQNICDENHISNIDIIRLNISKEAEKPWDFEKGYISFNLDFDNKQIAKNFTSELIANTKAVEALYFSKLNNIIINKDINVGPKCYYIKKDIREYNGETYDIYEGRAGNNKSLLFITKDGVRIFGHQRRKLLRELGFARQK